MLSEFIEGNKKGGDENDRIRKTSRRRTAKRNEVEEKLAVQSRQV